MEASVGWGRGERRLDLGFMEAWPVRQEKGNEGLPNQSAG